MPCLQGRYFPRRVCARLGEIRSILPPDFHVTAVTVNATTMLRKSVMRSLTMQQAEVVAVSPDKSDIKYAFAIFISFREAFLPMIDNLAKDKLQMGRTILPYF